MSLNSISQDELEMLSYTDLTELILKDKGSSMNTAEVFKTIAKLLSLSDEEYASKIGDFYTSLTTDKRFIFLDETAEWDSRNRHTAQVVVADDDDEDDEESEEEVEDEIETDENSEEDIDSLSADDDDLDDDDISELNIVSDEELDEN